MKRFLLSTIAVVTTLYGDAVANAVGYQNATGKIHCQVNAPGGSDDPDIVLMTCVLPANTVDTEKMAKFPGDFFHFAAPKGSQYYILRWKNDRGVYVSGTSSAPPISPGGRAPSTMVCLQGFGSGCQFMCQSSPQGDIVCMDRRNYDGVRVGDNRLMIMYGGIKVWIYPEDNG